MNRSLLTVFVLFTIILVFNGVCLAGNSSVTLFWTAPGDDGTQGTASEYDVRYAIFPITEDNWDSCLQADGEPVPQVSGSAESFIVTGLADNTTYYFAIKAADEVPNWSGLSNVVSITTPDTQAPGTINDLSGQIVLGDMNGDGILNPIDVLFIMACVFKNECIQ